MSDDDNVEEVDNLDADSLLSKAREDALAIGKLRKDLESSLEEISEIKDDVEQVSTDATAAQGVVISNRDAASENATAAEQHKNTVFQLLNTAKAEIQTERDNAIALLETIKKYEVSTRLIANIANEKDTKVNDYECAK